jgi:hypothetical protein
VADYAVRLLPDRISRARGAASGGTPGAYAEAADELARQLFDNGDAKEDRAAAGRARTALKALAATADSRATLLVRLVSSDRRLVYAPVGILSAPGEKQVIQGALIVVQPLPIERRMPVGRCVTPWAFGVPTAIDGQPNKIGGGKYLDGLRFPADEWLTGPLDKLDTLASFLSGTNELPNGTDPQGLLLLAHHEGGKLWFTNQDRNVIYYSDIARTFPSGSMAMLAACSTSSGTAENRLLLNQLNANGIDAVISSPFPVPAEFGVPLAINFAHVIEDIRTGKLTGGGWTLDRLLEEAKSRTIDEIQSEPTLADLLYEFQIVGNPAIEICPFRR